MSTTSENSSSGDSTRERILIEAGPIFADKGFRATTVREISDHANVNVASINYYFGDKRNLYHQTVVLAREMRVEQVPEPNWDATTTSDQKLLDFITLILRRLVAMQTEPWQVRLLMREILEPTETCKHLVEEYFRPFFNTLCGIIDDLVGHPLPEPTRNKIGFSIIGQCLYYRFSAELTRMMIEQQDYVDQYDLDNLAKHIYLFSIDGIRTYPALDATAVKDSSTSKIKEQFQR